jgi:hypothetical protein
MRPEGVFHNLVKDENDYSDLLCNPLQLPLVRTAFSRLLGEHEPLPNSFTTRSRTEERGIPDISYEDEDRSYLIEVKVHTSTLLTGHQPLSYLKHLLEYPKQKQRKLFFLVPSGYQHEARVRAAHSLWSHKTEIALQFVYWEDFYRELASVQQPPDETFDNGMFRSFLAVLGARFYYKDIKMTDDLLKDLNNGSLVVRYEQIRTMVKNVRMKFVNNGNFQVEDMYWDFERYGFNIGRKTGKYLFWVGILHALWIETGHAIAIFAASSDHRKFYQKLLSEKAQDFHYDGVDYLFLPFIPDAKDLDPVMACHGFVQRNIQRA